MGDGIRAAVPGRGRIPVRPRTVPGHGIQRRTVKHGRGRLITRLPVLAPGAETDIVGRAEGKTGQRLPKNRAARGNRVELMDARHVLRRGAEVDRHRRRARAAKARAKDRHLRLQRIEEDRECRIRENRLHRTGLLAHQSRSRLARIRGAAGPHLRGVVDRRMDGAVLQRNLRAERQRRYAHPDAGLAFRIPRLDIVRENVAIRIEEQHVAVILAEELRIAEARRIIAQAHEDRRIRQRLAGRNFRRREHDG